MPDYHTSLLFSGFSNVCHSACVWPTALKLGCITNSDMLFLVMGLISLVDQIQFMLISSRHDCIRSFKNTKVKHFSGKRNQHWISTGFIGMGERLTRHHRKFSEVLYDGPLSLPFHHTGPYKRAIFKTNGLWLLGLIHLLSCALSIISLQWNPVNTTTNGP